jgi:hypothetical protein
VLFFKYYLIPEKKVKFNKKKHKKAKHQKKDTSKTVVIKKKSSDAKRTLIENISLIKEIIKVALETFSKHLHVKMSRMHLSISTPDAADTAILYGAASGAVSALIELIDSYTNLKKLKKCAVIVAPDFISEKSHVSIDITLSISVWGILITLGKTFWKYTFLKNRK